MTEHPWREDALAAAGARAVPHRAARATRSPCCAGPATLLVEQLGVDPGPALRRLETDILRQAAHLDRRPTGRRRVWAQAAAAYDRAVAAGARARLESTVGLLRNLAVTGGGGLEAAREHRLAAIAAAEELGDAELTARVIGAYDVPAIWTRSDDPAQAAQVVAAAERTLAALPPGGARGGAGPAAGHDRAGVARHAAAPRGPQAARRGRASSPAAWTIRRCWRSRSTACSCRPSTAPGLAPRRDAIGAELVEPGAPGTAWSPTRCSATSSASRRAARSATSRRPTGTPRRRTAWPSATSCRWSGCSPAGTARCGSPRRRAPGPRRRPRTATAAARLDGAGMPGLERGLLPLALLCLRLTDGPAVPPHERATDADWGPYEPWIRPLVLWPGRRAEPARALRALPDPPRDLLFEALWCLDRGGRRARRPADDGARPRRARPGGGRTGRRGQRPAHPGPGGRVSGGDRGGVGGLSRPPGPSRRPVASPPPRRQPQFPRP